MTRLTAMVVLCYYSNPSTVRNGGKQERQKSFSQATTTTAFGAKLTIKFGLTRIIGSDGAIINQHNYCSCLTPRITQAY